ncbi:EAL domain-containing protein [Chromobacterium aquaticum]|uniref:cyclic-guanylate-specific phosphodiesterase n=1 Tax=Chromobacterium aquaticum TaxID=467180 RepID=A0ABV8ZTU8_9NEIS|nr:EAL domain-containing protein [Chromobacterium aquaticum]MCD5363680.1 EAL domain-containing protein [Chromobacterium aquaticum]
MNHANSLARAMIARRRPLPARISRGLLVFVAAVLPLLVITPIVYWQESQRLRQQAIIQADQAENMLDMMLGYAEQAADKVLPLTGRTCGAIEQELRRQVTVVPFIRSVTLERNGVLYCSSLFGVYHQQTSPPEPARPGQNLLLLPGNALTPGRPLIIYRKRPKEIAVLIAIDGIHLQFSLDMASDHGPVYMQVGRNWIGPDHAVHAGPSPRFDLVTIEQQSAHYPYSVITGFSRRDLYRQLGSSYELVFFSMAALGLVLAAALQWQLNRPASPTVELQRALDNGEFEAFLQPVVRADGLAWHGAEALMRWRHPRDGLIRPDLFIPRAEDCGMIVPMTRRMMHQLARALGRAGLPPQFHLGINITAAHLRDDALLDDCRQFLAHFPPGGLNLVLELTEREMVEPTPEACARLQRLRELGVMIAIDDFGTGHSSLVYLQQLPLDGIKIDKSFTASIGADAPSSHIVDSVAELAHKLELQIVAEGVETEAQRAYLSRLGVGWLQGYLFAKPMPLQEFLQRPELDAVRAAASDI